jgi:hypothetical protein
MLQADRVSLKIGFDFGGPFAKSRRGTESGEVIHLLRPRDYRPVPGSIQQLGRLINLVGAESVYFVKRALDLHEEEYFRSWLVVNRVFERTGLIESNVFICRNRNDKAHYCIEHGIHVMVDDRYEVFQGFAKMHVLGSFTRLIAFKPKPEERARYQRGLEHHHIVEVFTWKDLMRILTEIAEKGGYNIQNPYPLPVPEKTIDLYTEVGMHVVKTTMKGNKEKK